MTKKAEDIRRARVLILAAQLDLVMSAELVTQASLARKIESDRATVNKMLQGKDGLVSTWIAAVEALGYEVILKRKDVAS